MEWMTYVLQVNGYFAASSLYGALHNLAQNQRWPFFPPGQGRSSCKLGSVLTVNKLKIRDYLWQLAPILRAHNHNVNKVQRRNRCLKSLVGSTWGKDNIRCWQNTKPLAARSENMLRPFGPKRLVDAMDEATYLSAYRTLWNVSIHIYELTYEIQVYITQPLGPTLYRQAMNEIHWETVRPLLSPYRECRYWTSTPTRRIKEIHLTRKALVTLAQLIQTEYCSMLNSCLSTLNPSIPNKCPACEDAPNDTNTNQLITCLLKPTQLAPLLLGSKPAETAQTAHFLGVASAYAR